LVSNFPNLANHVGKKWKTMQIQEKKVKAREKSPKVNPRVLMLALLQMTIATDDIIDRHNAPTVPS
jgi:hypothetical protein